jgi:hypothetical protein
VDHFFHPSARAALVTNIASESKETSKADGVPGHAKRGVGKRMGWNNWPRRNADCRTE